MPAFAENSSLTVTTLPRRTIAGCPDFQIKNGTAKLTGYIEAKTPGRNLDEVERTEQLKRYLSAFPNLILTNFLEFRLYRDGRRLTVVEIGRDEILRTLNKKPPLENVDAFMRLFTQFTGFSMPSVTTARELAGRARLLRYEVMENELKNDRNHQLTALMRGFKQALLPELTQELFADLFTQTVTYGLFAARLKNQGRTFKRDTALNAIPASLGVLHDLMKYIAYLEETAASAVWYWMVPVDTSMQKVYEKWVSLKDVFTVNGVGMTTARDAFVIDTNKQALLSRISRFRYDTTPVTVTSQGDSKNYLEIVENLLHSRHGIRRKKGWSIFKAWSMLQSENDLEKYVVPVLYRPFDVRWIFYHDALVWRTVKRVMRHMLEGENLALITPRQHKNEFGALISNTLGVHKTVAAYDINYYFPLYLYPETGSTDREREPNIDPRVLEALETAYGELPSPESILFYIYAVLYSQTYRKRYAEFLRRDFPRVPFTRDCTLFNQMADLGRRLADLHLLKGQELSPPAARFDGTGDGVVNRVRYDEDAQRVWINSGQYFHEVPKPVWEYRIGGYQVLQKYLKDRKGRRLDDPVRYIHIITAITRTMVIQGEIDELYPPCETETVKIGLSNRQDDLFG